MSLGNFFDSDSEGPLSGGANGQRATLVFQLEDRLISDRVSVGIDQLHHQGDLQSENILASRGDQSNRNFHTVPFPSSVFEPNHVSERDGGGGGRGGRGAFAA